MAGGQVSAEALAAAGIARVEGNLDVGDRGVAGALRARHVYESNRQRRLQSAGRFHELAGGPGVL